MKNLKLLILTYCTYVLNGLICMDVCMKPDGVPQTIFMWPPVPQISLCSLLYLKNLASLSLFSVGSLELFLFHTLCVLFSNPFKYLHAGKPLKSLLFICASLFIINLNINPHVRSLLFNVLVYLPRGGGGIPLPEII